MTNSWTDIANADLVVVMGGNAAEAHPCGFKWVLEARSRRKAKLIVVDPRLTRTAAVADLYVPIRPGTDIAWLGGLINYLLGNDKLHRDYVASFTNAPYLIKQGFGFKDGLFSGYNEAKRVYDMASWGYDLDQDGHVKTDPTLQDPRCVFQLMKHHYARYTPEMVERITGSPRDKLMTAWQWIAETARPDKTMTSMYALGWTQHSVGTQNIRTMAMAQLLLGNVGMPGGGMNALRGHSNIQGLTDLGLLSNLIPGYLTLATEQEPDLASYMKSRGFKPLRPGQLSYWQNYKKFFVSFQKAMWSKAATPENDFAFDYLPKLDVSYDMLRIYNMMYEGKVNGYICQGFNPLQSAPNKAKVSGALAKLKFLVVMDPLATETASFWEDHGEYNRTDPAKIRTEVFRLPTSCFAEEDGTLVNSSRWLQWHWKGAEPPGEAKSDIAIMAGLFLRLRDLYRKQGGAFPDPIVNLNWPYARPELPSAEEVSKELNGSAVEDVADPKDPSKKILTAGQQLDGFFQLRDDGKTACGCWIYSGSFTEKGNMAARRETSDPSGLGLVPEWAWSWPANRRILYNRASCDPRGQPWDPSRTLIKWGGSKWVGFDVPDFVPASKPEAGMGPFIMQPEGTARLFTLGLLRDGPFPEHYEPFEAPIKNPLHPQVNANPVARVFKGDLEVFGKVADFPHVGTTYRVTELFHFWSKHTLINAILQPQQFVEIGEELAKAKGIAAGDWIKVRSNRGELSAVAVVTKRIKPLVVDGKPVHVVGLPFHWGFTGRTKKGYPSNVLTPFVGDANAETPEFKAFLVDVEKTSPPTA
jgi:formate dehydrogenase-N alpha subunit